MGITQVTTCKGRLEYISKNIKRWLNSGIDELVLVDFNCPQETGYRIAYDYKDTLGLTVVIIKPELAGDFFHLTKARNVGAIAAKHEVLFFCDADTWTTSIFIEKQRSQFEDRGVDLLINRVEASRENTIHRSTSDIPVQWGLDGQCFIKNSLLYSLNGYNESHQNWGGESYDLYIRASNVGAKIAQFDKTGIIITPHNDTVRNTHLRNQFDSPDRKNYFLKSLRYLKRNRKISRVNPGKRFGADVKDSDHITLFRNGKQRVWRPGEDDYIY
jgi:glycosyltransferase involved in cell wall biosynthesis